MDLCSHWIGDGRCRTPVVPHSPIRCSAGSALRSRAAFEKYRLTVPPALATSPSMKKSIAVTLTLLGVLLLLWPSPRRPAEVSFANFKPWFNHYATIQLLHRTDGRALPTRLLVDRVCRSSRSSPLQAPQARLAKLRFSHTPSISSGKLTATSSRPNTVARQPLVVESGQIR